MWMMWQRMLHPGFCAGVAPRWQENYAAMVSGFFRRKRESVSSQGDLFRRVFGGNRLSSDSGAAHASPLRWDSIFHAGPFRPSNQLFEHQA